MKQLESLAPNAQQLAAESVAWIDRFWDEAAGLLWSPGDAPDPQTFDAPIYHLVRDSAWYALGLFLRNRGDDAARAVRILEAVLANQYDAPDQPYHGTFRRAPEEPHPPAAPAEWRDYDPNWREFIFTTVAIILCEYEERLPRPLAARINAGLRLAVEGALARPLRASYTNIALMNAYLLCFAGVRLGEPEWVARGERMAAEIHRLFKLHDTFEEYNSPTYYGPDMAALAQWRAYPVSPLLAELGAEMEAGLWLDIARFYHAGLRNLSGSFDRSYGMDMRRYVAIIGQWIWLVTGKALAPHPDPAARFRHAPDFCFAPLVAILGAHVPAETVPHFVAFQGTRLVERVISDSPRRVATAWLGPDRMIGGQHTSRGKQGHAQFHPATIYWRVPPDEVGWVRLIHTDPVDAVASENRLEVAGTGELIFQISVPSDLRGLRDLEGLRWQLPGLVVQVESDAADVRVGVKSDVTEVHYVTDWGKAIACTLKCLPGQVG